MKIFANEVTVPVVLFKTLRVALADMMNITAILN